jgi:hypothetical protein
MYTPPVTPPSPLASNPPEKAFSPTAKKIETPTPPPPASHPPEKAFSAAATYSAGDAVSFEGMNYICTTANTGQSPLSSYWSRTGPHST